MSGGSAFPIRSRISICLNRNSPFLPSSFWAAALAEDTISFLYDMYDTFAYNNGVGIGGDFRGMV